ncbi:MAG: InlB B-repeat-containing protein [Paludibacter sp.]|nr:InlB B-repeat-containing protein [Paludibacter sp.]
MKKLLSISILFAAVLGIFGTQAQEFSFRPIDIFNYWVSRTPGFNPESSTLLNTYNYNPSNHSTEIKTDINTGTGSSAMYSNALLTFIRNNGTTRLYHLQDSIFMQATDKQGVSVRLANAVNNVSGKYRILLEYSATNSSGRVIEMTCGTDTAYDTVMVGSGNHRVAAYTLRATGQQTVKFLNRKLEPWPSGGNLAIFGLYVFNASVGGYILNAEVNNLNGGSVIRTPHKVAYNIGETVHLEAVTKAGYTFVGWSDGEQDAERDVQMANNDLTLKALFTPNEYTFAVNIDPSDAGSVSISPQQTSYHVGDRITLVATAASASYEFLNWSDGNTSASRIYTMPAQNVTLTARFRSLTPRSLTVSASPANSGDITVTPRVIPTADGVYFDGDIVDLQATARTGYEFVRWSDGTDDPEYTVRFNGQNINLVAEFRAETGNPPTPAVLPKPIIKVDFNVSGRQEKEVNEPRYTAWVVTSTPSAMNFGDVAVTINKAGTAGSGLRTSWWKTGLQAPYFARLVNDGVTVDGGDGGGQISLTFSGLRKGTHSLLLYSNVWDTPNATYSPVDIFVDNVFMERITPTNRVTDNMAASVSYIEFPVRDYQDVVVRVEAVTSGTETIKNVFLNGFELNVSNPKQQARYPSPADMDEHVDADDGNVVLKWQKAFSGADSHDVYFGTDSLEVASATHQSSAFKGNQAANDTTYSVSNIYSLETYYWRVDEVKNGETTHGNVWYFRPRVLAFRDAEGYGKYARGARGGKVVYVTNLNNDGEGSFREAIRDDIGARYVVFAVGGNIELNPGERITLNSNYVNVAGQTAPGKGVVISKASFGVSGSRDAIVRFMRVRVGQWGVTIDGMGMNDANYSIMDHNSISWTLDEAFSSRNGKNFTLSRTAISEALNVANHQNYSYGSTHGYAATIGGDTASFLCNLLAHCEGRNWSLGGGLNGDGYYAGHIDITNNVVFNYGGRVTDGGAHEVNFVNNYYRKGTSSTSGMLKAQHEGTGMGTQKYYAKGNVLENVNGTFDCTGNETTDCGCSDTWDSGEATRYDAFVDEPFFPNHATVMTARNAFKSVVSDCGANMPVLDEHDLRVALETRDKTWKYKGSYSGKWGLPDHHLDVGGFEEYPAITLNLDEFDSDRDGLPNWYETEISHTNPNSTLGDYGDTNADPDHDGNTLMEDYLEYMATPHYETPKNRQVAIELSQYTLGYTASPAYSVVTADNGTVTISGNYARFQPALNFTGITYFEFKVTDAQGDEMTRRIGVRVQ